jgi:hypothetical protein
VAVLSRQHARIAPGRTAVVALIVFAGAAAALAALRADSPTAVLTPAQAEAAALDAPEVRYAVAGGFTRVRTMPLDEHTVRVSFFDGPRAVAEAAVDADGRVEAMIRHDGLHARLGSDVGQRPLVLGVLIALFLLATLRVPLLRRENLDALAVAAVAVPIVLVNERYLEWSALVAAVLLAYLAWRCLCVARGDAMPSGWLIEKLPRRATAVLAGSAAAVLVLLSVPGGLVSDVGFASMAGATQILDGRLPYGHLGFEGLVHGDTYPLLAYLAYVPAALVDPVRNGFDGGDGALWVATACALAAALALGRFAGARLAIALLAFPPVMVAASSGSNDAVAAALVAGAVALSARAGSGSGAMTAAGLVKLAPFAALPLWLGRGRRRAAATAAAATAVLASVVLALGGPGGVGDMIGAVSFQSERGSPMSLWALIDLPPMQVAFQAAVLTGIVLAAVRVGRDRVLAADPRRIAALAAAILIGVQLAANHWSATYLAWVFPLLAVALFTPSPARASLRPAARR